eukprot:TRINITY_DN3042_c0_g1_i1.p1 TRINITY_DN3042_c0_g1~~TRINITY_DN3042_c0_g1_i1.p1  ORF type:complete len:4305 (+),score=884.29 TRINITY_DN3042_c0_g1_i1:1356-12917(+)
MRNIIMHQNYVMTPTFANKLMIIDERRRCKQPIILSGDTGLGKTEMLSLYSLIINQDIQTKQGYVVADLLEETINFVENIILLNEQGVPRHPELDKYLVRTGNKYRMKPEFKIKDDQGANAVIHLLLGLAQEKTNAAQPQPQAAQQQPQNQMPFLGFVAKRFVDFVRGFLKKYFLVKRTPLLLQIFNSDANAQPEELPPREGEQALIADFEGFKSVVNEFISSKFEKLFYRILMHPMISAEVLRTSIMEVKEQALQFQALNPVQPPVVVVFIDEANTASQLGIIKSLFTDHRIHGEKLPSNVFFVAAINPDELNKAANLLENKDLFDSTGVKHPTKYKEFEVRPLPGSLEQCILKFENLTAEEEMCFLSSLIQMRYVGGELNISVVHQANLTSLILMGQQAIRDAKMFRARVSIRDIFRVVLLYEYLLEREGVYFTRDADLDHDSYHQKCLIIAISLGYYFRLPTTVADNSWTCVNCTFKNDLGDSLCGACGFIPDDDDDDQPAQKQQKPKVDRNWFSTKVEKKLRIKNFKKIIHEIMLQFYRSTKVPEGIACTESLLENLFATAVCVDAGIPLIIVGPPGCSKTLSFTIVSDNMKGATSESATFAKLKRMHPIRYQCSQFSTDVEIESTFNSAIARKQEINTNEEVCCVLLDEGNLPDEKEMPLKVLHYKLDHNEVSTVIIANRPLDAAKTNRGLQIYQSSTSKDDLKALASGCLYGQTLDEIKERAVVRIPQQMDALCRAFLQSNDFSKDVRPEVFHLRDFVYLLRYIRQHSKYALQDYRIDPTVLLRALLRNFNGIPEANLEKLIHNWYRELGNAHGAKDPNWAPPPKSRFATATNLLKESLSERVRPGDNINTSAFRYIMVVDPTDNASALSIMQSRGIIDSSKAVFVVLGDFEDDATEAMYTQSILKVKTAMTNGDTVVLVNSGPINNSFYDVFNKHFTTIAGNDKDGAQGDYQYYANIAIGSYSKPVVVHPNFKIVVHIPLSEFKTVPLPFINRFEKYIISIEDIFGSTVKELGKNIRITRDGSSVNLNDYEVVYEGVEDFVNRVHCQGQNNRLLYGLIGRETISSLLLSILDNSRSTTGKLISRLALRVDSNNNSSNNDEINNNNSLLAKDDNSINNNDTKDNDIRSSFLIEDYSVMYSQIQDEIITDDTIDQLKNRHQMAIRQVNMILLQLAKPESIFFCSNPTLPKEYIVEYLVNQDHFSILRFIKNLINVHYDYRHPQHQEHSRKWCIFTRSSGDLGSQLEQDTLVLKNIHSWIAKHGLVPEDVHIFSLNSITCGSDCEERIQQISETGSRGVIIITADMRESTKNQVNTLRNHIDSKITDGFIVIVILHFPPEIASGPPVYPAIYLNEWDFLYSDSLGRSDLIDLDQQGYNYKKGAIIDNRSWVMKSFGLNQGVVSNISSSESFRTMFFETIGTVLHFSGKMLMPRILAELKKTRVFYMTGPRAAKIAFIKGVFERFPFLYTALIDRFTQSWTSRLLNVVMNHVLQQLKSGKVIGPITDELQKNMKFLFGPQVVQILDFLTSQFSLEQILSLLENESLKGPSRELIEKILMTINPPDMSVDTTYLSDFTKVKVIENQSYTMIPMYIQLDLRIRDVVKKSIQKLNAKSRSIATVYEYVSSWLEKEDTVLLTAMEYINQHEVWRNYFIQDFFHITLKMPNLNTPWTDVSFIILKALCEREQIPCNLISMFVITELDSNCMSHLNMCLEPLKGLKPSPTFAGNNFEMDSIAANSEQIGGSILKLTIHVLWDRIREILFESGDEEVFLNWNVVFRSFRSRINSRSQISALLEGSRQSLVHFDICMCIFTFMLDYSDKHLIADLLSIWQNQNVLDYIKNVDKTKEDDNSCDLEKIMELLSVVESLLKEEHKKPPKTLQLWHQDVVINFIAPGRYIIERNDYSNSLKDVKYLMSLFCEDPALVSNHWLLINLNTWVNNQQKIVAEAFFNTCGELLVKDNDAYNFIWNWKNTNVAGPKNNSPRRLLRSGSGLEYLLFNLILKYKEKNYDDTKGIAAMCRELMEKNNDKSNLCTYKLGKAALCVLILRRVAVALSDEEQNLIELVDTWTREESFQAIKGIFLAKLIHDPADYLFSLVSDTRLPIVLSDKQFICAELGLPKYYVAERCEVSPLYLFPFMITEDQNDEDAAYFDEIHNLIQNGNLQQFDKFLNDTIVDDKTKYRARMFIILVIYYFYFNTGKSCGFIKQQLDNPNSVLIRKLEILAVEKKAYAFLASEPLSNVQEMFDRLSFNFCKEVREKNNEARFDLNTAHIMVNCLAVALGCPSNTTHFYDRIFHIERLHNTKGPGSDYQRMNWDCGYKFDPFLTCMTNPPVMSNITVHRLSINSLVWAAISWCCLFDDQAHQKARANHHFLNTTQDSHLSRQGRARTDAEVIKTYMYDRFAVFFRALEQDPELASSNVSAEHFITVVLYQFWRTVHSPDRPAALKSILNTEQEAKEYEDVFQGIFKFVWDNYGHFKQIYQQDVARVKMLKHIIDLKQAQSKVINNPLDVSVEYLKTRVNSDSLLMFYMNQYSQYSALEHLPAVIHFYLAIHSLLSFRITEEELLSLSIKDAIGRVHEIEGVKKAEEFKLIFKRFQNSWRILFERIPAFQMCGAARAFEGEVPNLEFDTKLVALIPDTNNDNKGGFLIRMIETLSLIQNQFLNKRQTEGGNKNQQLHELLFEDLMTGLDVTALPLDSNQQYVLVSDMKDISEYALSFMEVKGSAPGKPYDNCEYVIEKTGITFDFDFIERFVLERSCGKFDIKIDNIPLFKFCNKAIIFGDDTQTPNATTSDKSKNKNDKEYKSRDERASSPALSSSSEASQESFPQLGTQANPLYVLSKRITGGPYLKKLPERDRYRLQQKFEQADINKILDLCDNLTEVIHCLFQQESQGFEGSEKFEIESQNFATIEEKWIQNPSQLYVVLSNHETSLCYLKEICELVVQIYLNKYNFPDLNRSSYFKDPLRTEDKNVLNKLKADLTGNGILSESDSIKWEEAVLKIKTTLIAPKLFSNLETYERETIKNLLLISNFDLNCIPHKQVDRIVPDTIKVNHYEAYVTFLHSLYGEMSLRRELYRNHVKRTKEMSGSINGGSNPIEEDFYQELVPQDLSIQYTRSIPHSCAYSLEGSVNSNVDFNDGGFMSFSFSDEINREMNGSSVDRYEGIHVLSFESNIIPYDAKNDVPRKGLTNYGISCWLNTQIQCLIHVPFFKQSLMVKKEHRTNPVDSESLFDIEINEEENEENPYVIPELTVPRERSLIVAFHDLIYNMCRYHNSDGDLVFNPSHFYNLFHKITDSQLNKSMQQDIAEFYTILHDLLLRELKNHDDKNQFISTTTILFDYIVSCENKSCTVERRETPSPILSVDLDYPSIRSCIEHYMEQEQVKDHICDTCKKASTTLVDKKVKFWPKILTVQLKRFEYDNFGTIKKNTKIEIDTELGFEEKIEEKDKDGKERTETKVFVYDLYGIGCHKGARSELGHYTALIKRRVRREEMMQETREEREQDEEEWVEIDDGRISKIEEKEVLNQKETAYILWYSLREQNLSKDNNNINDNNSSQIQNEEETEEEKLDGGLNQQENKKEEEKQEKNSGVEPVKEEKKLDASNQYKALVEAMSCSELVEWLSVVGFDNLVSHFTEQEIDGTALLSLFLESREELEQNLIEFGLDPTQIKHFEVVLNQKLTSGTNYVVPVQNLSVNQIVKWIERTFNDDKEMVNEQGFLKAWREQEINGEALLALSEEDLKEGFEEMKVLGRLWKFLRERRRLAGGKEEWRKKEIEEWSVGEVGEWLRREGFGEFVEGFAKERIDGGALRELLSMIEKDSSAAEFNGVVKTLGVKLLGPRAKIKKRVKELFD